MLNWATMVRVDGEWLLVENPLRGVKFPREPDPRRPVATFHRFEKLRQTIQRLVTEAPTVRERDKWVRLDLALVLAEGTGRRIGSIRQLRWGDINFDPPSIRWRAEFDKKRREQVVPIPEALASQLKGARVRLAVVGEDWVFKQTSKNARGRPRNARTSSGGRSWPVGLSGWMADGRT
jgi:integrase